MDSQLADAKKNQCAGKLLLQDSFSELSAQSLEQITHINL